MKRQNVNKTVLTSLTLCCFLAVTQGAEILAFAVSNSYSHFTVMEPLFLQLAARGHQITVVSSFPQKNPPPNYHDIAVGHLLVPIQSNLSVQTATEMGKDSFRNMVEIWDAGTRMCERVLKSGELRDLYNSTAHFDLVIAHTWTYECFSVFAHKFNTPIVSFVTSSALPWVNPRVGNPDHPAFVINNFLNVDEDMNIYQRTVNTVAWLFSTLGVGPLNYERSDAFVRKYLDPEAPSAVETMKRTSLVMVNSHFTLLQSRPFVPNFVEVGGIHVKDPKPLPKDLRKFLDAATEGVVVFSLGSIVRSASMPNSSLKALMDAFAELPQKVVFKFEEDVQDKPNNVMLRRWLPQRDILEHPNVKAFMGHGGQSSTIEAVYTGTPMVGLPLFSDQYSNIRSLVLRGTAVQLDVRRLTKESASQALRQVLQDPSYKENARRLSQEFRDRLASPLDTAVYWTEYVLRHRGAPRLRSRVADLPWYRFLLLDVAAVLSPVLVLAYFVVKFLVKSTLYYVFSVFVSTKKPKYD
ncbi:UDP-glucosyltransferase 2-like [Macrosteles quadrilineatus]|uniref:UDP-glucosyltransferase 2-like n=1 Tax=Macrosteles quadrilineatus TaxID=74068 RepID=UPI0023E16735|nr:UDP-glucosyltransferase 2-like [Macrosteles quadrilineatus]